MLKQILNELEKLTLNEYGEVPDLLLEKKYEEFSSKEEKGTYISYVMVKIWNLLLPKHSVLFKKIDNKTGQSLCDSFFFELNEDFCEWIKVLRTIDSSDYMVRSGKFSLTLKNTSRISFIRKIKKKELGVRDNIFIPEIKRLALDSMLKKINALSVSDLEKKFRSYLCKKINIEQYQYYFENAKINWDNWDGRVKGYREIEVISNRLDYKIINPSVTSIVRAFEAAFPLTKEELVAHQEYKQQDVCLREKIYNDYKKEIEEQKSKEKNEKLNPKPKKEVTASVPLSALINRLKNKNESQIQLV